MAVEETIDDLFSSDEMTAEKILNLLLEPKNINMKGHIETPYEIAVLEALVIRYRKLGFKKFSKFLDDLLRLFKEHMVSYKRMSRKEIIEALVAIRGEKTGSTFTQKLLGMKEK